VKIEGLGLAETVNMSRDTIILDAIIMGALEIGGTYPSAV
jgi:hypothetical protein